MSDRPYLFQELTGRNVDELKLQLNRELRKLANAYEETRLGKYPIHYSEPDRPRDGMVRYADGTTWDPGGGEGLYAYYDSRWNSLGSTDWLIEVNKGNIAGHSLVHKFGANGAVGTTGEDIWSYGGTLSYLTGAETMDIVSADTVNDIAGANNARSVYIEGLDSTFAVVSETVNLAATPTTTANSYIRVFRMYVVDVGVYGNTNAGQITATASTAATVQCAIEAGEGQSTVTHYTIPAGKTAYMLRASVTVQTGKECSIHINRRLNADDSITAPFSGFRQVHHWEGVDTPIEERFKANHIFPEKTDLKVSGNTTTGTANIQVDYDLLLVDNPA